MSSVLYLAWAYLAAALVALWVRRVALGDDGRGLYVAIGVGLTVCLFATIKAALA